MAKEAYKYVMNKYAGFLNFAKDVSDAVPGLGLAATAVLAGSSIISKLNNDTRRHALIEDLARNDPILRQVPKDKLISWYGIIYQYGPRASLNKEVTRDLLHTFARFGKADMQTLKLLAETEGAVGNSSRFSTGTTFGGLVR